MREYRLVGGSFCLGVCQHHMVSAKRHWTLSYPGQTRVCWPIRDVRSLLNKTCVTRYYERYLQCTRWIGKWKMFTSLAVIDKNNNKPLLSNEEREWWIVIFVSIYTPPSVNVLKIIRVKNELSSLRTVTALSVSLIVFVVVSAMISFIIDWNT